MKKTSAQKTSFELRIQEALFNAQDLKYMAFQSEMIPTIPVDSIIGVRTPDLKLIARNFSADPKINKFLNRLPHEYYDENQLHSFILSDIRDFDECVEQLEKFLPFVDNWATCDSLRPAAFRKNHDRLEGEIRRWMGSSEPFTVRFGMEMLMTHFLDGDFRPEQLEWVEKIDSNHYYVNMMAAWYFATALAKQYDAAVTYLEEARLSPWVHNKTIQKAIESFRVTEEHKAHLRVLRRKTGGEE